MVTENPPPSTPSPTAESVLARIHAYRLFWWLSLSVFVSDQLTKMWVHANIPFGTTRPPEAITVIDGFFYITHVGNPGAAWSLFAGYSTALAILAGATLVAIYLGRRSLGLKLTPVQLSFGLLCGGIVGNLVDRLVHGHVIDFLDFHFGSYVYPTFNIADSGIVVGVIVYLIHNFRQPSPPAEK